MTIVIKQGVNNVVFSPINKPVGNTILITTTNQQTKRVLTISIEAVITNNHVIFSLNTADYSDYFVNIGEYLVKITDELNNILFIGYFVIVPNEAENNYYQHITTNKTWTL